jgi:hypothetical protein
MATSSFWYGSGLLKVAQQSLNWAGTDTFKAALTTSAYVPNQDTHTHFGDVTSEVVGTGYTAGGMSLLNRSITYDAASNEVRFLADDISWTDSTLTARYLVIYNDTPAAGSKWLLGWVNFGADQISVASSFPISFSARRVLRQTAL